VEKTGTKRPWKSQERFPLSHSFNNKLDDRNHFLQNAKTSVASLRRLITPTRNADRDQPGTLITFIGIRSKALVLRTPRGKSARLRSLSPVLAGRNWNLLKTSAYTGSEL